MQPHPLELEPAKPHTSMTDKPAAIEAEILNLLGPMTLSSIAPESENHAALSENSPEKTAFLKVCYQSNPKIDTSKGKAKLAEEFSTLIQQITLLIQPYDPDFTLSVCLANLKGRKLEQENEFYIDVKANLETLLFLLAHAKPEKRRNLVRSDQSTFGQLNLCAMGLKTALTSLIRLLKNDSGLLAFLNNLGQTAAALTCRALNISSGEEVHFNYLALLEKVGITLRNSEITSTENFQMISLKIHTEESKALFYFYFFSLLDPILLTESYYETLIATLNRYQGKNFQSHMREAIAELCLDHPLIQENFSLSTFFVDPDDPAYDHTFQIVVSKKATTQPVSKKEKFRLEEEEALIKKEWMSYCKAILRIKKLLPTEIDAPLANELKIYLTKKEVIYPEEGQLNFITQRFDWLAFLMSWLDQYTDLSTISTSRLFQLFKSDRVPITDAWEFKQNFDTSIKICLIAFSSTEKGFSVFKKLIGIPYFFDQLFYNCLLQDKMNDLFTNVKLMSAIDEYLTKSNLFIPTKLWLRGDPKLLVRALDAVDIPTVLAWLKTVKWGEIPYDRLQEIFSIEVINKLISSPVAQSLVFEEPILRPLLLREPHPITLQPIFPGMPDFLKIKELFEKTKKKLAEFDASWCRYIYYFSDTMLNSAILFFFANAPLKSALENRRQAIAQTLLSVPSPKQFDTLLTRLHSDTLQLFLLNFLKPGAPIWQAETLDWLVDTLLKMTLVDDNLLIALENLLITKCESPSATNDLRFVEKCIKWVEQVRIQNPAPKAPLSKLNQQLVMFAFKLAVVAISKDDKSIQPILKLPLAWTQLHYQQLLNSAIQHNRIRLAREIVTYFKLDFSASGLDLAVLFFNPLLLDSFLTTSSGTSLSQTCETLQAQFTQRYIGSSQTCFSMEHPEENQRLIRSFECLAQQGALPLPSKVMGNLCGSGVDLLSLIIENECPTLLKHYLLTELNWVKQKGHPLELMERLRLSPTIPSEISASLSVVKPRSFLKVELFTTTSSAHRALEQQRCTEFLKTFYVQPLSKPMTDEEEWLAQYTHLLKTLSTAGEVFNVSLVFNDFLEKIFPTLYTEHNSRLKIRTLLETLVFKLQTSSVSRQKYTFIDEHISLFNELNNAPRLTQPTSIQRTMVMKTDEELVLERKPFVKHFNRIICALEQLINTLSNESLLYQMFDKKMDVLIQKLISEENVHYLPIRGYLKQLGFALVGIKLELSNDFLAIKNLSALAHEYRFNFLQGCWNIWYEQNTHQYPIEVAKILNLYENMPCKLQDLYDLHIWLSLADPVLEDRYAYDTFFARFEPVFQAWDPLATTTPTHLIAAKTAYCSALSSPRFYEAECTVLKQYLLNELPVDENALVPYWCSQQDLPTFLNNWLKTEKNLSNIHLPRLFHLCEAAKIHLKQSIIESVFSNTQDTFKQLLAYPHHFALLKKPDYFNLVWTVPALAKELIIALNFIGNPCSLEMLYEVDTQGKHFLHTLCTTLGNESSQMILSTINWGALNPRIRLINALVTPYSLTPYKSLLIDLFEHPFGRMLLFKEPMLRKIAELSLKLAFKIPFEPLPNLPDIQIPAAAETSIQMFTIFTVDEQALPFAEWACMPQLDTSICSELMSKIQMGLEKEFSEKDYSLELSGLCHEFFPYMSPPFMRAIFDVLVNYKKNKNLHARRKYPLSDLWTQIRTLKDLEHVLNTLTDQQGLEFLSGFIVDGRQLWKPTEISWLLPYLERLFKYLKPLKLEPFLSYIHSVIEENMRQMDIATLEKFILFLQKVLRTHFITPLTIEEICSFDLQNLTSTNNALKIHKHAILNLLKYLLSCLYFKIDQGIAEKDHKILNDAFLLSPDILHGVVNYSTLKTVIHETHNDALVLQFSIYTQQEEGMFNTAPKEYQPLPNKLSSLSFNIHPTKVASLSEGAVEIKPMAKKTNSPVGAQPLPAMDQTLMKMKNGVHQTSITPALPENELPKASTPSSRLSSMKSI